MAIQQGMNQQSPAVINTIRRAVSGWNNLGSKGQKRVLKSARKLGKAYRSMKKRRAKKAGGKKAGKPKRLVKGSLAAKRYMASIRKRRKK